MVQVYIVMCNVHVYELETMEQKLAKNEHHHPGLEGQVSCLRME